MFVVQAVNTPMLPTKFLNLKHLTIYICEEGTISPSYDYFSLLSFLDASPFLETFFLKVRLCPSYLIAKIFGHAY